jgi:phosphoglycolate phosphatase
MRLYLFDIDGTLVNAGGVGRTAVSNALKEVYGTTGAIGGYDFRGRTDPRIVCDLLGDAGWSENEIQARLATYFDVYLRELDALLGDGAGVRVLPGVADVVRALSAREDALVGLLTGNIEPGARLKLRSTGLWPLFRVGAFGSDHMDRRQLPAVARQRTREMFGHDIPFDRITIIGDTPLDVDCARASGASAVAVATGRYTGDELSACRPDALFPDLSDVTRVLDALCANPRTPAGGGV